MRFINLIKIRNVINEKEWPSSFSGPYLSYEKLCDNFVKYFEDCKDRNISSEDDKKIFQERELELEQKLKDKMAELCLQYENKLTFSNILRKVKKLFKIQ